jgi:cytochrome c
VRTFAAAAGLLALIAAANPPAPAAQDAGERAYQKCYACHALDPGLDQLGGPSLYRIFRRPVASDFSFREAYSPALRRLAANEPVWTPELLDRFIADPQAVAPGNNMGFFGIDDPAERAALIAWLAARTSGSPAERQPLF